MILKKIKNSPSKTSLFFINIGVFATIFSLYNGLYKPSFSLAFIIFFIICIFLGKEIFFETIQEFFSIKIVFSNLFCVFLLLISSFFSYDVLISIKTSIDYLLFMAPFFMLLYFSKQHNIFHSIYWGLVISTVFISTYAIYQYASNLGFAYNFFSMPITLFFPLQHFYNIESVLGNRNIFAGMLAMTLPFLFAVISSKNNSIPYKWGGYFVFFLGVSALLISGSRGAIIGIILANIIFFILSNRINTIFIKKLVCISFVIVILIGSLAPELSYRLANTDFNTSDKERQLLFKSGYEMWSDHKIFGVGSGNFASLYKSKYISPEATAFVTTPHNTFLYYLSETGIIGSIGFWTMNIFIFYFFYSQYLKNPYNKFLQAILIVLIYLFIHGLVDVFLCQTLRPTIRLFWCLIAIAYQSTKTEYTEKTIIE